MLQTDDRKGGAPQSGSAWSAIDFGAAMTAYVEAHAKHARQRPDGVTCEAFHRGGDNPEALRVWRDRGAWADARGGTGGGAIDFARIVAGLDLVEFMRAWGTAGGVRAAMPRHPATVRSAPEHPPRDEVAELWEAATPVTEDAAASGWLLSRALEPCRVADADAARAVPRSSRVSGWARQAGRTWAEAFQLVVPLFDSAGAMRSLHARRTVHNDELAKTSSPAGFTTKGLVMANAFGRGLLAAGTHARERVVHISTQTARAAVVIVEGLPDFLTWETEASDADADAPALFGILSGSWTAEHSASVPNGARVLIDTDADRAGDTYAQTIARSLAGRCNVGRLQRAAP